MRIFAGLYVGFKRTPACVINERGTRLFVAKNEKDCVVENDRSNLSCVES